MSAQDLLSDSTVTLSEFVEKMYVPIMDTLLEQSISPHLYPITPLPKPSRRTRVYRSLRKWLWHKPWDAVHRYAPGQCDCDCGEDW